MQDSTTTTYSFLPTPYQPRNTQLRHLNTQKPQVPTFRLNFGSNVCNISLTLSLSASWACSPFLFVKWNVDDTPLCKTTCNCTFTFPSGEIFWAKAHTSGKVATNLLPTFDVSVWVGHRHRVPILHHPNQPLIHQEKRPVTLLVADLGHLQQDIFARRSHS